MAFVRIRTIKGRQYRYREERWREGGKVRSHSTCLGPVGVDNDGVGWLRRQLGRSYGFDWDAIERQMTERMHAEDKTHAAREARVHLDLLHIGLSVPASPAGTPIEKPATVVDLSAAGAQPTARDAVEENAPPDGEAESQ
jgi:hypothetical protein